MAVYTNNYVVCGRANKILCIGIMAAPNESTLGRCVQHNKSKLTGVILYEKDDNILVLTEKQDKDHVVVSWLKSDVKNVDSGGGLKCRSINNTISSGLRHGIREWQPLYKVKDMIDKEALLKALDPPTFSSKNEMYKYMNEMHKYGGKRHTRRTSRKSRKHRKSRKNCK
jgi:hypothetical protein